jgi:arylsulfatase A-like enzyme
MTTSSERGLDRRAVLAGGASLALASCATSEGADALTEAGTRRGAAGRAPNIVFIMADDLGYADLSCYGRREYETPALDGLAASGVKFTQGYANSAVCSATRAALMTGRYQYRLPVGLEEPVGFNRVGLPPSHPTLPSLLREAGYQTALVGKWHLGAPPDYGPTQSGYDHFWGMRGGSVDYFTHEGFGGRHDLWDGEATIREVGYLTDLLGDKSVEMVRRMRADGRPFFLSLHFNAPHWPWEGPDDEAEAERLKAIGGQAILHFDGGDLQTYGAMVTAMDRAIGRVLATLEELGIVEETIVVFTSDNGGERFSDTWPFTGKKTELLEGGLRVPLIVRWPGLGAPGSVCGQAAATMDFMPTLLAAAGTTPHPDYPTDGMDLSAAIGGAAPVPRRLHFRFKHNSQEACRDGDWKYLKIRENTFLFNVADDPLERANLKARHPEVFERLVSAHRVWDATMLPITAKVFSHGYTGDQLADHFSSEH